ncbi:MAG: tRNA 2-thiouridine(34) synthase MnmA [Bacillota bacterium]|jgi:tRNA-specific 2-thiouridylase|nr:tRNA 2-thiouridine(34) synthase MnmA [Bacillota bacterium]
MERQFDAAVAMSGGVDSSVAAALLVEHGLKVIGVTLKLWYAQMDGCDDNLCCSVEAVESARRACRLLGIDHIVLNAEREFRETVVDNFIEAYSSGLTPNPCVVCNSIIKFGELHRRLAALGIKKVATGHYARLAGDPLTGRTLLLRPADRIKDQTYMLYRLTQRQLESSIFPLGDWTKPQVRAIARRFGLDSADRPDSQEVCFTPPGRYREFLLSERPWLGKKGPIVDLHGRTVGEHQGLAMYTIGQRHSLGRLLGYEGQAMYVVAIRPATNTIVVGPREAVYSKEMVVADLNWICYSEPPAIIRADVKVRYTTDPAPATLTVQDDGTVRVVFDQDQLAITPGQSAVFYQGDIVLGGGIIQPTQG